MGVAGGVRSTRCPLTVPQVGPKTRPNPHHSIVCLPGVLLIGTPDTYHTTEPSTPLTSPPTDHRVSLSSVVQVPAIRSVSTTRQTPSSRNAVKIGLKGTAYGTTHEAPKLFFSLIKEDTKVPFLKRVSVLELTDEF